MSASAFPVDSVPALPHGSDPFRHGDPLWLPAGAEAAAAAASLVILAALVSFFLRRREPGFPILAALLSLFLLSDATAHLARLWMLWRPDHGATGPVATGLAAVIGLASAVLLRPVLAKTLARPSPADLAREIEVRRAAEARARESEARLASLFEHMADAVFVVGQRPDGRFAYESVNPAFERLFGVGRDRLLGQGPRAFLDDEAVVALIERRYAEALAGHAPVAYEACGFTRAGYRHWHTVLAPIRDPEGQVVRLLGSVRDVTETRRLQADLQEAARLATVGSMCAGVAHEMSQPVNVIALWAGNARAALAAGRAEPERLARAFEVVLDQSRRIGALLERMRELTREEPAGPGARPAAPPRGEGGARPGAPAAEAEPGGPFDAAEAVAAVAAVASRQYAIEGTVELTLDRPPGTIPVQGRRAKLEQALLQLIANAHDAVLERRSREPGAPARIVVALRADHAGGVVAIAVRDTGGGVPEAVRGRIFDPFFTTKEPGRGTGLGLAIVQGVARSMGGRLETWNEAAGTAEAGAVFCLTLPLAAAAPVRPGPVRVGTAAA
ncbi:two-component system sensor histidine kinase NtrB [Caldovatus aquaticus]|uniref:histidine kinase n=1 Tax=Caldovatus aquaticus TaxID=2865671 RepID=A0ABS7F5F5_9PROT|nr:ATP-binding protein [Caldovatus aquaticus]MBW8270743.1 PAS domain-containing protein [Caldovatus aquaticus]